MDGRPWVRSNLDVADAREEPRRSEPRLPDSIPGGLPQFDRFLREDDVVFGYSGTHEFDGDGTIGGVVLDPNFAVDDIEVKDHRVNAAATLPAEVDEFEVVEDRIGRRNDSAKNKRLAKPFEGRLMRRVRLPHKDTAR